MQITNLGRSGLRVSRLCLGTMNFGPQTTEPEAYAIMDKALELGINFWDTADVYGWKRGEGVTEQIMGRYFAQGGRRDRVVLATKVFGDMDLPTQPDANFSRGLSARKIMLACERSLKRMQTSWLDLYQMHHIARECPWDEVWQAMDTLVQQGKIVYTGSSNFAAWNIATANQVAKSRNSLGLVCEQSKYSLACRHIELEVLPACRYYGVGVIAWSPLDGGILGGVNDPTGVRRKRDFDKRVTDKPGMADRLARWEKFCSSLGEQPANVALAWLLHQPGMTGPIIGPRTIAQLEGAVRATEITLSPESLKAIDEIWPGPGGQAPEAYAW